MKKLLLLVILLSAFASGYTCPACEARQPKVLRGITHGAGPESNWDFLIVATASVIVVATLFFSLKWLLSPGEKSETHIKRLVLNYD